MRHKTYKRRKRIMDNMEKLTDMFEEFLTLYKFVNKKTIADMLTTELNKPQLIEIYRFTDGEHSTRDIANMVTQKCTHATIANIWKRWALKGIVVSAATKGRFKAAFNLDEYGITQIQEEG